MRILITNVFLDVRGGTQLYVAELAEALLRRGHHPVVYSTILGPVAAELLARTVPVVSDLSSIGEAPDIIHGHHTLETITALVRFPHTPALYVSHDWAYPGDSAPKHPRIYRYLAVDDTLRDRLVAREGIPADRVGRTRNWVDTSRFPTRSTPLPTVPARALVFSNLASDLNFLPAIRAACEQHGIQLDVAGLGANQPVEKPETLLHHYDLVFAKARAAIEAMGSGCAVVLCDLGGLGGMVTSDRFRVLREVNFGRRCLREKVTAESISEAISKYDPQDAQNVCALVRSGSSQTQVIDELVDEYQTVINLHRVAYSSGASPAWAERDGSAAAVVVGSLTNHIRTLEFENHQLHAGLQAAESGAGDHLEVAAQLEATRAELNQTRQDLMQIRTSSTFVARDRLLARVALTRTLLPFVQRVANGRR